MTTYEEAQNSIDNFKKYSRNTWMPLENGWFVIKNPTVSGITGNLNWSFIKPLEKPLEVTVKTRHGNLTGHASFIRYQSGFNSINKKDIHLHTLSFDCDLLRDGKVSGFTNIGMTKSFMKLFTKVGIDLIDIPNINDDVVFPKVNEAIQELHELERSIKFGMPTMEEWKVNNDIRLQKQKEIIKTITPNI